MIGVDEATMVNQEKGRTKPVKKSLENLRTIFRI
jgi:hypothetical protein